MNPLRAGIVKDWRELNRYPWAGHSALVGRVRREWQDTGTVLSFFAGRERGAMKGYEKYVAEGIPWGKRPELVGGGLIRSLGGWSEVLSLRRRGVKAVSDERVLGGRDFVMRLFSEAGQREKEMLRFLVKGADLAALVKRIVEGGR